ncbi:uncharacterized protein BXZ73DRAFT_45830, partial [Epithele typhae]|uniref:uncharacterized protein n=1 Tax=Epithele typhae TaxID=378194 RepID=UPI002008B836
MTPSTRNRPAGDGDGDEPNTSKRSSKAQEQELKRARGAISCAECRRLKLKCDKTVPCTSCKRRGCASICPNGSLTTGQGTRFILADTDRLHQKIIDMSDRIRQLEDGLSILQSTVSREPHPLLSKELLKIKSSLELHSAAELSALEALQREFSTTCDEVSGEEHDPPIIDAFGTLALRDDGAATFYGRSACSEVRRAPSGREIEPSALHAGQHIFWTSRSATRHQPVCGVVPSRAPDIPVFDMKDIIQSYIPPWSRAAQLRDFYLDQAPWFSGAISRHQLCSELLPFFYAEAAEEALTHPTASTSAHVYGHFSAEGGCTVASAHELALVCAVFCFGALMDPTLPAAANNVEAGRYYQLARAALALEPVMDRPPGIATVQVLVLMGVHQSFVSNEHSVESIWALSGLSARLAQSVNHDCSRFKLSPAEIQKRRGLFWEVFILDCWQALATGRLPSFQLQFVDTEFPADLDETLDEEGNPSPSFAAWKIRWGKECLHSVVMGTLTAEAPKYSVILDLDRRLRDVSLPCASQGPPPRNPTFGEMMTYYMPIYYLHTSLLYIHRCFFAHALTDCPTDPMRSQHAPSFLAGYCSATTLLNTLREQFVLFPAAISRFPFLWAHAFSASVRIMLASVITRGGTTKTAQAALGELRVACEMFESAATLGGTASKFLSVLRKMHDKAQMAYFQDLQPLPPNIFQTHMDAQTLDELAIFSGRTPRTIMTKSGREPLRLSQAGSTQSLVSVFAAGTPSDMPSMFDPTDADPFPGLDSAFRAGVHPGLVAEFDAFDNHLNAQI